MPELDPASATRRRGLITIRLQREDFDIAAELAAIKRARTDIGAVVTFTGVCRGNDEGEAIAAMTLEHYPGMAEAEIARHVEMAQQRWPLQGVSIIHRHGRLVPGDNIVLVVTAASHRQDAFAAAAFLMDYLKTRAPFWKREERGAGTAWVGAREEDAAAAARWRESSRREEAAE
jgi:molybdopterin synthase catalytic subunit